METISYWISQYGYFAIFSLLVLGIVGLPVPDEWLLTFAGFLVYRHRLSLAPTFAAAFFGSACGITGSFMIGRTLGFYLIRKYGPWLHVTQDKVNLVHDWFGRFGTWTLLFGYFIPGVRHLTAIFAGTSELRLPLFGLFAYSGAFLWVGTFISIGYFFGNKWAQVLGEVQDHVAVITWVLLGLLTFYLFVRLLKKRG